MRDNAPDPKDRRHTNAQRRALLLGVLAGCAVAGMQFGLVAESLAQRIRQLLASTQNSHPEVSLARAVVFGSSHAHVSIERWTDTTLMRRIRANIEADYQHGRIINQRGWRISTTEAAALELLRRLHVL
jgi:hypothetical protein